MDLLNDSMVHALCRTFAHSLWQGLLLAVLTGLIIQLTRRKSAAYRYNLLSLLLAGFLITISATFMNELGNYKVSAVNREGGGLTATKAKVDYTPETVASLADTSPLLAKIQYTTNRFLHNYAGLIVGLWFLVFCYKLLNTVNGLKSVYRIRNYQVSEPEVKWTQKVQSMQEQLKIAFRVRLLESRLVDIPSVTGFFKPVILLPIGMINNLPQEQVEAILLHELAHIRRADYLVNLLQRFVETLFFFNPAVLWLSSLIKDERENCCDDIAVNITGNKRHFVEALVSFQEYSRATPEYSLGLSDGRSSLLNRSKRLLYSSNTTLSLMEKSALSVCLVLLVAVSFAFSGTNLIINKGNSAVTAKVSPDSVSGVLYADRNYDPDEIPEGTCMQFTDVINGHSQPTWLFKSNDTLYQISGDIRLFKINGELIPQEKYRQYLPKIRDLMAAYEERKAMLTGFLDETHTKLMEDKKGAGSKKRKVPDHHTTSTTVTTTITTTTITEDGIVTRIVSDSSIVRSCSPAAKDSLTGNMISCYAAPLYGPAYSNYYTKTYQQAPEKTTACRQ